MKNKTTSYVFCFEDLLDFYSGRIHFVSRKLEDRTSLRAKQLKEEAMRTILENEEVLRKVEKATLRFAQQLILDDPSVIIAKTKDIKTDIVYLTAKTRWPQEGGRSKEVKIHIGKESNYVGGTQSDVVRKEAITKMKQTLQRRLEEGSL
jgi:hypothetical protein